MRVILIAAVCAGYVALAHKWVLSPFYGPMVSGFGGIITIDRVCSAIEKHYPFILIDPRGLENPSPDHVLPLWQAHEVRARLWVALSWPAIAIVLSEILRMKRRADNKMPRPIP